MTAGAVAVPTIVPLRAPYLGQHKTAVDTATRIELHSDTDNVRIYYTLNGTKPELYQTIGPSAKATFLYREPFTLTAGRRTIKAIAVAEDGRESFVVTKVFDVEKLESDAVVSPTDDLDFIRDIPVAQQAKREVQKFADKMVTGREAWAEIQRMKETAGELHEYSGSGDVGGSGLHKFVSRPSGSYMTNGMDAVRHLPGPSRTLPADAAYQPVKLQTDPSKCMRCFAPRSSDMAAKFCAECGAFLPSLFQLSVSAPDTNQMGPCQNCRSVVPLNMPKCLVCEAPFSAHQNQNCIPFVPPRDNVEHLVCMICGMTNSPNRTMTCVTCSANLRTNAKVVKPAAVTPTRQISMKCADCGRGNSADARFCDWCGSKSSLLAAAVGSIVCPTCSALNSPGLQYCSTCGMTLAASHAAPYRNGCNPLGQHSTLAVGQMTHGQFFNPLAAGTLTKPVMVDAVTQTVGLYYPSQREISRKEQEIADKATSDAAERKPLLSTISPGRGYWRKQMEHICGHLKAYAANSADFRAIVAEPRLGKLVSATVDEDNDEMSVTANFELHHVAAPRGHRHYQDGNYTDDSESTDGLRGVSRKLLHTYSSGRRPNLARRTSRDSLESDDNISSRSKRSARKPPIKRPAKSKVIKKQVTDVSSQLSAEEKKLIKEVGKNGDGRPAEIRQWIEDGASPNCVNKDGFPVLQVAVHNGHAHAVTALIKEGAEVSGKGPTNGNTALHEAVAMGTNGYRVIDALLESGASVKIKNDKGETPYDLAVKNGHDAIVKKFAAFLGQTSLDKLAKPRPARLSNEV
jgi:hypothetical protein